LVGLSFAVPRIRHCADAPVVFFSLTEGAELPKI